jgi:hypothetical protein
MEPLRSGDLEVWRLWKYKCVPGNCNVWLRKEGRMSGTAGLVYTKAKWDATDWVRSVKCRLSAKSS